MKQTKDKLLKKIDNITSDYFIATDKLDTDSIDKRILTLINQEKKEEIDDFVEWLYSNPKFHYEGILVRFKSDYLSTHNREQEGKNA